MKPADFDRIGHPGMGGQVKIIWSRRFVRGTWSISARDGKQLPQPLTDCMITVRSSNGAERRARSSNDPERFAQVLLRGLAAEGLKPCSSPARSSAPLPEGSCN